jgi:serine/threonine protein kinase
MTGSPLIDLVVICFGIALGVLAIIFLVVPILKGVGWMIGGLFNALGWILRHTFEFVAGMLADVVRFVGAIIAGIVLLPIMLISVIIGRWSAAGHFFRSMKRECGVGVTCLYRVALQRPLRFLLLGGLLEGVEERVNEAWENAPTSDKPRRRTGTFEGYTIVGSLPGGGSGAKLYVAEPDGTGRKAAKMPERVVIKSFTITDGSSLPQIVRESRALEAAKQLGLVLDHGMDEHRFFYVMPYRHGEHLGIITRQLHGRSDGRGLSGRHLSEAFGYVQDLLATLSRYHGAGLWHKDVKPDNLIVHGGRAHLVDLGLVTPLRSAMTLTTHGTEYFRDPEMVRMALRGVKVHQVDGAKFDIYAAGAVLYFVLENTFPAHGGLSTFGKKSPEAARWIIRRSMTDYAKRYETAAQMLTDLDHVARAPDPYAVKPAELPSMGGADAPPIDEPEAAPAVEVEVIAAAGTPVPPAPLITPPPAEPAPAAAPPAEREAKPPRSRPRIRVTNWWTGAYEVVDAEGKVRTDSAQLRTEARAMRDEVRGLRSQSQNLRHQVHMGRMTARRAAREQIKQARARAREMQRRARTHRHQALHAVNVKKKDRQPSGLMAFLTLVILIPFLALAAGLWRTNQAREVAVHERTLAISSGGSAYGGPGVAGPLKVLLINDHPAATNASVQKWVDQLVKTTEDRGWEVIVADDSEVIVRQYLPAGPIDPDDRNPLLRDAMGDLGLGGVLRVSTYPGDGAPHERINGLMLALPENPDDPFVRVEAQPTAFR